MPVCKLHPDDFAIADEEVALARFSLQPNRWMDRSLTFGED
jgi:hypothetical protein